jgi:hypothetical protein
MLAGYTKNRGARISRFQFFLRDGSMAAYAAAKHG